MSNEQLDELNGRFALPGAVRFESFHGGLPVACLASAHATAKVALHGAHVLAFQPDGAAPVLWLSARSRYEAGAPIRGGMPVCWPWFGPHPSVPTLPIHGFARIEPWACAGTWALADGVTRLALRLAGAADSRPGWSHPFDLQLVVTLSAALEVELIATNTGTQPFACSAALHSYFAVSDVTSVKVHGLEGCRYLDTVPVPPAEGVQHGPVTIGAEVDRAYFDTAATCTIEDPGLRRNIRIAKRGSLSTVVWNPWIAKAARMPDFGDDEYPGMLCVETANAREDARTLAPGESHSLVAEISVEPQA